MKKVAVGMLAVCSLISSSCATLLKGNSEEIAVVSDPSGAEVTANEVREGTTPVTFKVPSKEDLNITVTKPGYQPQDLEDPTSFRWGYEIWAFLEFVIPMGVDLADGAAWGHDHMTVTAHLEPNAKATPAEAASSSLAAPPVASTQSAPLTAAAPAVPPEGVAAAPVGAPEALPSASAMQQQPAVTVAPTGPMPTTPE